MTEIEFFLKYRRSAVMGGDAVPRRAPQWECSCCGRRFRKVNPDGSDAALKVRLLRNVRPAPVTSAQVYAVVKHLPDTFVVTQGRVMLMI